MPTLKLVGRLSYIESELGRSIRLKFAYIDMAEKIDHYSDLTSREYKNTYNKLIRNCGDNTAERVLPYDDTEFTVLVLGAYTHEDFDDLVGRDCVIHVSLNKYNFVSTFDYNRGTNISGSTLYLKNIVMLS